MPLNVPTGAATVVIMLNRAFNNTAPANADFFEQIASAGNTLESQMAFARSKGAALDALTDAQFAAHVLGNFGVLPNPDLLDALIVVLGMNPKADRGVIVMNLGNLLSGLEGATGEQAIYAAQAVAWNNEVNQSFQYSSDSSNTTPFVGEFPATYTLTAGAASVNEGATATFALSTTNVAAGTEVAYTLSGIDAADLASGSLTGTAVVGADGKATISVALAADVTTEGAEALTVTLDGKSVTAQTTVNDTSVAPAPVFAIAASAASVDEGGTVTFQVTGAQANFAYTYNLTGVDAADINGALTGTVNTDANGNGTITVVLANDRVTDGVDTLVATLPNTGVSASVTVNDTSTNNIAPVAEAATGATTEAGAVVAGQLVATDAENDALTFALDAAVEGLTLNADGTYSFDPSLNSAAQALTYKSEPLAVVANYTVTDALGATHTSTLTITVTPKPLTFAITADKASAEEGATTVYTVTASEALVDPVDVVFTLVPGDGVAVNAGTSNTNTTDFATGAFNPKTVTIAAGATAATFDVVAVNDATTELQETYSVKAEIAGQPALTLSGKVVDATGEGGVGQTFTLTTGVDTMPGLIGSANSAGTDGNDTIVATDTTLTALDSLNGGKGADILNFTDLSAGVFAMPAGLVISSVETVNIRSSNDATLNLTASPGITGVTALNSTQSTTATLTAAATTDVGVSGATGNVIVNGGKNVNVSLNVANAAPQTIDVGAAGADAAGTVTITATGGAAANGANVAYGAIAVGGGTTVNVTQKVGDASALVVGGATATHTQGNVTVTGSASTTTVTVKQDAEVTAVAGNAAVAGVTESASVKFSAMTAGQTLIMGGLTFTAAKALTAAEAAASFANLTSNFAPLAGDTQGSGLVANGVYTGAFTGWTSGAASGDTVVFTSTVAGPVGNLTNGGTGAVTVTTTDGVAAVAAAAAKVGVVAGAVSVVDASAAIKTITLDGLGAAASSTTTTSVLETLNVSNQAAGSALTVADSAATLALNLQNVGTALGNATLTITAAPATLNVKSTGANYVALTAALTETLNVTGTGALNASANDLAALKTVKVSETAGLSLNAGVANTVTSVDTTGTTGAVSVTIEGARATYAGGAGVDTVTLATDTALTKAINLGGGDDTLSFAALAVTGSTAALNGGDGTDTLSMAVATADALDAAVQSFYTGFERLTLNDAGGAAVAINLENLGFTNYVTTSGSGGTLTLNNLANNGTVVIGAAPTTGTTVGIKDAATGTADVLNVVLGSAANLAAGVLTAAEVETVNINGGTTLNTDTMTLTADKATTVNVSGSSNLTLTMTGSTKVTLIDASSMTAGSLTVTSLNTTAATTIKGGVGNDVLKAAAGTTADVLEGGAGNDTLTGNAGLSTLTGGAGNDLFVLNVASLDVNSYATITDFAAGDLLQIAGIDTFKSAKVTLGDTAVFQDYANAAINALGANDAGWFQFGGNTYVVADIGNTAAFVNATDFVIKLSGLVDLSNASFNDASDTIALV